MQLILFDISTNTMMPSSGRSGWPNGLVRILCVLAHTFLPSINDTSQNNGPQCSYNQIVRFLDETQTYMDKTDWVERYAWFGAMADTPINKVTVASWVFRELRLWVFRILDLWILQGKLMTLASSILALKHQRHTVVLHNYGFLFVTLFFPWCLCFW